MIIPNELICSLQSVVASPNRLFQFILDVVSTEMHFVLLVIRVILHILLVYQIKSNITCGIIAAIALIFFI